MSGKNPFFDDEEVDDFEFLNHPQQGSSGYVFGEEKNNSVRLKPDYESRQQLLLEERRRIEDRTLQSTNSSLVMLHESEQVGISTAEELVRQREQLQNVEKNVDTINSSMRISQKHINSIKSVFGGIKSYFSGRNEEKSPNTLTEEKQPEASKLQRTMGELTSTQRDLSNEPHPALRIRNIDYGNESDFDKPVGQNNYREAQKQNFEEKFDSNLEDMSLGIGRLKNLAIGLNDEIEDHNEMLDRIYSKTDHADETLTHQNREIKRILKK